MYCSRQKMIDLSVIYIRAFNLIWFSQKEKNYLLYGKYSELFRPITENVTYDFP